MEEKRGRFLNEGTGQRELLVLRAGILRHFEVTSARDGRHGPFLGQIPLAHPCEIRTQPGGRLEILRTVPMEVRHAFKTESDAVARDWAEALERSCAAARRRYKELLNFLAQGCVAYKYNYSNSKRMRRHFWLEVAPGRVELRWARAKGDEHQCQELKECVGVIFGPMTTTFARAVKLEDPEWCCFSLLFPDRTLDMAVPPVPGCENASTVWFLGLQHLLLERSPACATEFSEAQLVFRRVFQKLRHSARRQQLTTRTLLLKRLHALGKDSGFREELRGLATTAGGAAARAPPQRPSPASTPISASAGGSPTSRASSLLTEVSSKTREGEKHRKKSSKETPSTHSGSHAGSPTAGQAPEEAELASLAGELERQAQAAGARLEALRPQLEAAAPGLGADLLGHLHEVFRQEGVSWQVEKCAELEGEALSLRLSRGSAERQAQAGERAEKQLRKMATQLRETEAQVAAMEEALKSASAGAQRSETAKQSSKAALESTEVQTGQLERRRSELEQQLLQARQGGEEAARSLQEQNKRQADELARLEQDKARLQKDIDALSKEHEDVERRRRDNEQKVTRCESLSRNLAASLGKLQGHVGGLRSLHRKARAECDEKLRSIADMFKPLSGAVQTIGQSSNSLVERYRELEEERKKLHNIVLELKGNIRVFVRVRPMSEKEKSQESSSEATISFAEDCKVAVYDVGQSRRKWFEFDRAFQPKASQQEVFEEVKPLATSVLDGYNVCIFAYGQTGSGKTFTMTGIPSNPGLNVRVLSELFRIRTQRAVDADIKICLSMVEIYNENIKDLLDSKAKKLDVKTNPDGSSSVPGVAEVAVQSVEEVLKAMEEGQGNRTVMGTDMNEESSRSHSIVQVKTVTRTKKDRKEYIGKINLIDLAGSENVNKSGVTGQGMKEAQNINKSLSALGDVIQALVAKSQHIPYRNSKLTMMLKDSLGGDSKTLMIVQCSPAQSNVTETLSSLNFASRARNVELGKAKKNVKQGAD